MTAGDFLARLRARGVVFGLDAAGRATCTGPADVLTPDVRAGVARHEARFRELLEAERLAVPVAVPAPGTCAKCGRPAWPECGAARLASGELVCGDCETPADIAAGSSPTRLEVNPCAT